MYRRVCIWSCLLFVTLCAVTETDAAPRRRYSRNYYYNYNYSYGWTQVAPKLDDESDAYQRLGVYYDYDITSSDTEAYTDRIRVAFEIRDEAILQSNEPLVAEVKLTDVTNYDTTHVRYVPVNLQPADDEGHRIGTFELTNGPERVPLINPATIYRLFINLHREAADFGPSSAWGRVPSPYYVATSGDTDLQRARQKIVMRTFKEWYYTERGWRSNERYPMDCHAYYMWATGICTVGASNGWTNLGQLFGGDVPYHNGSHIPGLMEASPIHGDYVRKPGHTFMLLAYDEERGHVWTMEANFNHTIEVVIRSVGSGWTVGHLQPEHIREDLFEVSYDAAAMNSGNMAAATPVRDSNEPRETIQ